MRLQDCRFLADENIDIGVVSHLRAQGVEVASVLERGWKGCPDVQLLESAKAETRVVLTHDRDFGQLAINEPARVYGIVYLRPGHLDLSFTLGTLATIWRDAPDLRVPFILVASRAGDDVSIRVRFLDGHASVAPNS